MQMSLMEPASLSPATADGACSAPSLTVIQPRASWRALDLRDVWRYRELLYFLTLRDIKVRYKQTILGAAWAVIQPLTTTGVFVVIFGLIMGRGKEPTVPGTPYVLSTFCAMLAWQLFATSVNRSSNSLAMEQNLVAKVYFPRLILPLSSVLSGLIDFAIASVVMGLLMVCYGVPPTWNAMFLPLFVLLTVIAALAIGLWLSVLGVIYRDFRYALPFLIQVAMYVSPVIYATSVLKSALPRWLLMLYGLNPMVGVIEGFRWALLGSADVPVKIFVVSTTMTLGLFVAGLYFFHRMQRSIVDVI